MKGGRSKASTPKKANAKLGTKRKISEKARSKPPKREKGGNDPNKSKGSSSAFVFMQEFNAEYKVSKAGGDKWKSLSDADKNPYQAKAAKWKTEYTKTSHLINKKDRHA